MKKILMCVVLVMAVVIAAGANAGDYLVYDPGGDQNHIVDAMNILGFTYDVENASNFNPDDIASHDALIIGWSVNGDYSGISNNSAAIQADITGNRLITGHDADYHTWNNNAAATTLFDRYVLFAGGSPGNPGILAFPMFAADAFGYLNGAWGITSTGRLAEETITSITADGIASGLYAGLTTADLSNWLNSYHGVLDSFDSSFKVFETGSYNGGSDVTIGTTVTPISVPEPSTLLLLGAGLAGVGFLRRRFKS